ncbi:MAG: CBS domain-containing protein [Chloroflexota bacterium]
MKTIGELVKGGPLYCVNGRQTVMEAVQLMAGKHIGALPVLEGDRLVGIFTERDLMVRVVAAGKAPADVRVNEVMTTDLVVGEVDETLQDALNKMQCKECRHLPVVSGDQLVGVVSVRDLLTLDREVKEQEIQLLDAYIRYIPPPPPRE